MIKLDQFRHCISVDVETTGIDPERNSIVSIGAVSIQDYRPDEPNRGFSVENYLRDGAEIDDRALAVNGENREDLLNRVNLAYHNYCDEFEALLQLIEYATTHNAFVIIGKNPRFDYDFLKEIWIRAGKQERDFPFTYRVIDYSTMVIPLMLWDGLIIPEDGLSSGAIQKYLEIEDEPKPHVALNGARWNLLALEKIVDKYNCLGWAY